MITLRGKQYRVTRADGTEISEGDTVLSFRGESATFIGLERGPEHNGTSKVRVTWADGYTNSYYHTVFNLTVTPV